jgi:hypothetical protein
MDEASANAGGAQEPSIEEILASIRRIISDDGEEAPADTPAVVETVAAASPKPEPVLVVDEPTPEPVEEPVEDVLELTELVRDPEPAPEPEPAPYRAEAPAPARRADYADDDALVSEPVARRAADVLARVNPREADGTDDPLPIPHRTLEEVVRELLRPMLRQWLDAHLPGIVERAVDRELRRVSRRADELH